jgi:miniconductance mechanosensitive channel
MADFLDLTLAQFWQGLRLSAVWAERIDKLIAFAVWLVITALFFFIADRVIAPLFRRLIAATKATWDDTFVQKHVVGRTLRLLALVAASLLFPLFLDIDKGSVAAFIARVLAACIELTAALAISGFLESLNDIYMNAAGDKSKRRPIKSYIQILQIAVYVVTGILIITTLMNVSPAGILTGLGAMSAVLMLVFKDSIVGFVSSLQLAGNDMVRIGDWIEMPTYNADGSVIDITLQSVSVQNWDNTISTIPIYSLLTNSFKNWRGMSESGGRRIMRSIYIDQRSVRFISKEEFERYSKMPHLARYMKEKREEIVKYNEENNIDPEDYVTGRHMTNLGTFRAYTANYLQQLPEAAKGMTNMVRYLQSNENGIQVQIYLFSADKVWEHYESIQADIIDHLLAVLPEFDLKVFQNPSGYDMEMIAENLKH